MRAPVSGRPGKRADGHQAGHLVLGQPDLAAPEPGQGEVRHGEAEAVNLLGSANVLGFVSSVSSVGGRDAGDVADILQGVRHARFPVFA